ncbi:MAG: DUF3048 domain-containing protein, partial [Bacilli bacterium]|nr:DUF3048 domain-containing protein [Bacilli bacterium]
NISGESKIKVVDINSDSRSVAVMINNHNSARPYHMGLQEAYLVYEIIVEGGSTRYMAIYKDKDIDKLGSVRSARHYFLDYVLENDAIFVHWGWSDQAKDDINELEIDNINGLFYENSYFYRDKSLNVSLEHTGFTNTALINKGIDKMKYRNITNKNLLLNYSADEIELSQLSGAILANDLEFKYSSVLTTSYKYDENNKRYLRFVNGKEHTDYVSKEQYNAKNIIVYQVSNHTLNGDVKGRQEIDNIGSGKGYFISNGYAVPIKWNKKSRSSQTVYTFEDGTEIKANDGNTFIQIVPTSGKVVIS